MRGPARRPRRGPRSPARRRGRRRVHHLLRAPQPARPPVHAAQDARFVQGAGSGRSGRCRTRRARAGGAGRAPVGWPARARLVGRRRRFQPRLHRSVGRAAGAAAGRASCSARRSTIGGTEAKRAAMAEPRTFTVTEDDDGIRLDRWFKRNLPEASFNIVSRWARTGQLRLDGKRAAPGDRIDAGQQIRIPPPEATPERASAAAAQGRVADPGRNRTGARDGDLLRTRMPSFSPSRRGSRRRAGPRPTTTSTGCSTASPTMPAPGPSWSIGSTRILRARCWSRGRRGRRVISPRPSPAAPRARSIGRWSSACRRPRKD